MRWLVTGRPGYGEKRAVRRFLWWPLALHIASGKVVIRRWLEWAELEQIYTIDLKWYPLRWLDM